MIAALLPEISRWRETDVGWEWCVDAGRGWRILDGDDRVFRLFRFCPGDDGHAKIDVVCGDDGAVVLFPSAAAAKTRAESLEAA